MAEALYVLIPTHGRPTLLRRTLDSLAACRLPDGYRETVVVENGSRDGAEAVVAEAAAAHPVLRLRYMHVEWGNKSHALNEALKTVAEGLVVFFDDDVRLAPEVLVAYAEAAEGCCGGTFFGSSFGVDYEEPPPPWLVPLLPFSARGMDLQSEDRLWEYLGFNWAAFAGDIRKLGGFDLAFGPGSPTGATGQETNMQHRMVAAGMTRIDLPEVLVWHYIPKERCTALWTARRKFKSGVAANLVETNQGKLNTARRALTLGMKSALTAVSKTIRRDKTGQWRALGGLYFSAGLLRSALRRNSS